MKIFKQLPIKSVQEKLLTWFRNTNRKLPWRVTYNPYHIWISEIMLQQTQMERGVNYFNNWVKRFPDVNAVADADENEIMKMWEGLGYYARARNLHAAAKTLKKDFNGELPCDHDILLSLPGIGPYTAAAISSIACNCDIPVVDANVMRVYARLFDIEIPVKEKRARQQIENIAVQLLPKGKARRFNQALMDFGGLVCLPRSPQCDGCFLQGDCLSYLRGTVSSRPVVGEGKKTILISMATAILEHDGKVFIQQRNSQDIWGGLWEFPGGRIEEGETAEDAVVREYMEETGFTVTVCEYVTTVTHYYTRYKVVLQCYLCRLESVVGKDRIPTLTAAQDSVWVEPDQLEGYGFPSGHRKLLEFIHNEKPELLYSGCAE